jgi:hypothetical protein
MQPEFMINHLAVLVCVVAAMPLEFLWFGPLFGKATKQAHRYAG